MAPTKCAKCTKVRVKTAGEICASCSKKTPNNDSHELVDSPIIVNEALMYAQCHRDGATKEGVIRVMAGFYTNEVLRDAKSLLWTRCGHLDILEPWQARQNSSNRNEREALSDDIYRALGVLEENNVDVICVAKSWNMLPRTHPEAVQELSIAEVISEMQGKFRVFTESLANMREDICQNTQKLMSVEGDCKTHGQLLHQVINGDVIQKKPTMAQVVSAGRSVLQTQSRPQPRSSGGTGNRSEEIPPKRGNDDTATPVRHTQPEQAF